MVCEAVLGEVIGADFLAAIARADLRLPRCCDLFLLPPPFGLVELASEYLESLFAVLALRAFIRAGDRDTGGLVSDADRRIILLHVLAAGPAGPEGDDLEIAGIKLEFHIFDFGQNGDSGGRGVNASL